MGSLSPLHWMLVLVVVLLLFGTGRISSVMGDFAKGLKAFKKNMAEDDASMDTGDRPAGSIAAPNAPKPAAAPQTQAHAETTTVPHS